MSQDGRPPSAGAFTTHRFTAAFNNSFASQAGSTSEQVALTSPVRVPDGLVHKRTDSQLAACQDR